MPRSLFVFDLGPNSDVCIEIYHQEQEAIKVNDQPAEHWLQPLSPGNLSVLRAVHARLHSRSRLVRSLA